MKILINGEDVVVVTKDTNVNPMDVYILENQPEELAGKEQKSGITKNIKKEEVKSYVRDTKILKSNLKNICSLVKGQYTGGVLVVLQG